MIWPSGGRKSSCGCSCFNICSITWPFISDAACFGTAWSCSVELSSLIVIPLHNVVFYQDQFLQSQLRVPLGPAHLMLVMESAACLILFLTPLSFGGHCHVGSLWRSAFAGHAWTISGFAEMVQAWDAASWPCAAHQRNWHGATFTCAAFAEAVSFLHVRASLILTSVLLHMWVMPTEPHSQFMFTGSLLLCTSRNCRWGGWSREAGKWPSLSRLQGRGMSGWVPFVVLTCPATQCQRAEWGGQICTCHRGHEQKPGTKSSPFGLDAVQNDPAAAWLTEQSIVMCSTICMRPFQSHYYDHYDL